MATTWNPSDKGTNITLSSGDLVASNLAGGGGFDVIGNLKSFAGLDRLVFAGGGATGAIASPWMSA